MAFRPYTHLEHNRLFGAGRALGQHYISIVITVSLSSTKWRCCTHISLCFSLSKDTWHINQLAKEHSCESKDYPRAGKTVEVKKSNIGTIIYHCPLLLTLSPTSFSPAPPHTHSYTHVEYFFVSLNKGIGDITKQRVRLCMTVYNSLLC